MDRVPHPLAELFECASAFNVTTDKGLWGDAAQTLLPDTIKDIIETVARFLHSGLAKIAPKALLLSSYLLRRAEVGDSGDFLSFHEVWRLAVIEADDTWGNT
jgi:hypothetical protein